MNLARELGGLNAHYESLSRNEDLAQNEAYEAHLASGDSLPRKTKKNNSVGSIAV